MTRLPILPVTHDATHDAASSEPPLSRRGFVSATTWSLLSSALAAACGGGGGGDAPTSPTTPTTPTLPSGSGVTFSNNVLSVPLAALPNLTQSNGFQVFGNVGGQPANIIVINLGNNVYKAFSSICTHEGCSVGTFDGRRIGCPCHGSTFDTSGVNVGGPAPRPLAEYRASLDATAGTLTVTKT